METSRYDISRSQLLTEGGLTDFREVRIVDPDYDPSLFCLEQVAAVAYSGRPTDIVMDLVNSVRPRLWRIATTVPDDAYRKYYIHMTPTTETHRVPQLASLWLLFFYFGSVVRYRPHLFDNVMSGSFGPFVSEFISAQSEQLLYLLASEMAQREVAKPAII